MSHIAQQNPAAELRLTVPLLIWGGNDSMLDLTQLMRQLDDLAGRQPERLMNDAIELVKRANRIPMEAQNRALLLERAVRCQQFLLEKHRAARRQIGQLVASDSLGSERLLLLTEEIGFGYKRLLLSQAETFASVDEQAQTLHGAITALSQQLLLCLDLRRARSRSLWGEFHRLFHYAERMKTENQQFRDVDGAVDAKLSGLYLRVVLTFAADPHALSLSEHWILQPYLARWCDEVRLAPSIQPASVSHPDSAVVDLRALDINVLLKRVQQHHLQISAGSPAQTVGFEPHVSAAQALRLIDHLLDRWGQKRQRGAERRVCRMTVALVIGFLAIYRYLRGQLSSREPSSAHSLIDTVMENESDNGAALRLPADYQGTVPVVGELVLMAERSGFGPVRQTLGWVRWNRLSPRGEMSFGLEYLHATAHAVDLDQFDGSTLSASQRQALLLVRSADESLPFSLIAQPHIYRPDRSLRLAFAHRIELQQAVAGRMIVSNGSYDHFLLEGDLDVTQAISDEIIEIDYDPFPFNLGSSS